MSVSTICTIITMILGALVLLLLCVNATNRTDNKASDICLLWSIVVFLLMVFITVFVQEQEVPHCPTCETFVHTNYCPDCGYDMSDCQEKEVK